jgi:hypothetical protein
MIQEDLKTAFARVETLSLISKLIKDSEKLIYLSV